jgi:hypothetical protein
MKQPGAMLRKLTYVGLAVVLVAFAGVHSVTEQLPIGPVVLGLAAIPLLGLLVARRSLLSATPDLIFGAIDTGLLAIPALWGGLAFGVAGAIAGGVIGDALTDAIAGFFEGGIAEWLRERGIEESREPVTSGLGKMAGCLLGSGLVLCVALLAGIEPTFR